MEQGGRIFPVCRARGNSPCPGATGEIALHRQGMIWGGLELEWHRMTQVGRVSCPTSCPKQDQPQVSLLNALSGQVLDRMGYQALWAPCSIA